MMKTKIAKFFGLALALSMALILVMPFGAYADRTWFPPDQTGHAGQFLSTDGTTTSWQTAGGSVTYTNATPTPSTLGGIAAGSTFSAQTMTQMWNALLYPYIAPSTTLVLSPAAGLREKGNSVAAPGLTSVTTKHTNNITTFVFNNSVVASPLIPVATGGTETGTDGAGASTTKTYTATVGDGTSTGTASATYTFISAYYHGVAAPGRTPAQVAALTKQVINNTATVIETESPSSQVFYFAYPDSYPALSQILDPNGFNITADFTVTTGNSITNSFGNTDTYRIYEYNNLTTQTAFAITYKQ